MIWLRAVYPIIVKAIQAGAKKYGPQIVSYGLLQLLSSLQNKGNKTFSVRAMPRRSGVSELVELDSSVLDCTSIEQAFHSTLKDKAMEIMPNMPLIAAGIVEYVKEKATGPVTGLIVTHPKLATMIASNLNRDLKTLTQLQRLQSTSNTNDGMVAKAITPALNIDASGLLARDKTAFNEGRTKIYRDINHVRQTLDGYEGDAEMQLHDDKIVKVDSNGDLFINVAGLVTKREVTTTK